MICCLTNGLVETGKFVAGCAVMIFDGISLGCVLNHIDSAGNHPVYRTMGALADADNQHHEDVVFNPVHDAVAGAIEIEFVVTAQVSARAVVHLFADEGIFLQLGQLFPDKLAQ